MKKSGFLLLIAILLSLFASTQVTAQSTLWGMTSKGGDNGAGTIFYTDINGQNHKLEYPFFKVEGALPYYGRLCYYNGLLYGMTSQGGAYNMGVIYSYDPQTNIYKIRANFKGAANGNAPYGGLTLASNGKMYGVTALGGANSVGVLFEFNPVTNSLIKRFDFSTADGSYPYGELFQASNGKLYGMTNRGGSSNSGVIYEFDPLTNTYTKKLDFNGTNGANPVGGFVEENGILIGMTTNGGLYSAGVLFEYNIATNMIVKQFNFGVPGQGKNPYGTLVKANGLLFGTTNKGGALNKGTIFNYDPVTHIYHHDFSFDSVNSGARPYGSLMLSSNGNLFGTASAGGANNMGVLFEFNTVSFTYTKHWDFDGWASGNKPMSALYEYQPDHIYGTTNLGGRMNKGVLFDFVPSATFCEVKMDFQDLKNGCYPYGSLMQASDGNLYGMASLGGRRGYGVIFKYDPATKIYDIILALDSTGSGYAPNGSIIEASNGKLYGLVTGGGQHGVGLMWEYDLNSQAFNVLVNFNGQLTGASPYGSLIELNGKLIGMTREGGQYGNGAIFDWDLTTNVFTRRYSFPSTAATGRYPYGSLMLASDGMLYGMASAGGAANVGTIFQYNPNTYVVTKIADFTAGTSGTGYAPYGDLIEDNGKFYGLTSLGGANSVGTLFEYNPTTSAVTKKVEFSSMIGAKPYGTLFKSSSGKMYGMTYEGGLYNRGVIFEFDQNTGLYTVTKHLNDSIGSYPKYTRFIEICILPQIVESPRSDTVCIYGNQEFGVVVGGSGIFYQWQVNDGSGYTDLTDNAVYSGTNSDTLRISNATLALNGNRYRCVVVNLCPPDTLVSDSAILTVSYTPVSFSGLDTAYCINDAPVTLTGSPVGGTFSGNGIQGNVFNPALAGMGTHMITYDYTNISGCTFSDTAYVKVNATSISFTGLDTAYCIYSPPVTLTGSPSGGVFSGPGMTNNIFTPSAAGAGWHQITYSYLDSHGCITTLTKTVHVRQTTPAFTGLDTAYCINSSPDVLTGIPSGGVFSGNGITGNVFNPANAVPGYNQITYTYTDLLGCVFTAFQTTNVHSENVTLSGLSPHYCLYSPAVPLTGTPPGGYFNGPGVAGNTFYPFIAGPGTKRIIYFYSDPYGCDYSDTVFVYVDYFSVAFSGLPDTCCLWDGPFTLTGYPAGGTFSGNGISGNTFIPLNANPGTHIITYSYTDSLNCTFSRTDTVFVEVCVGIPEKTETFGKIRVVPNPSKGEFILHLPEEAGNCSIEIFNPLGDLIYQNESKGLKSVSITLNKPSQGLYFLKVMNGRQIKTFKLIIQ